MKQQTGKPTYLIWFQSVFNKAECCVSDLTSCVSRLPFHVYLPCLLFALTACNDSFQPLESNDQYFFSMYGYLDASADTQWIHITPIREQVDMLDEVPEMQVTLENVDTGQEVVMNDSLFQRGAKFLNFWTRGEIGYNQSYRIKAELPGGEKSEVTVITPDEMPLPKVVVFTNPGSPPKYFVFVDKRVNLADIQTRYYILIRASNVVVRRTFTFAYRNAAEITQEFPGYYTVEIKPDAEINEIERQILLPPDGEFEVINRQVYVAASGIKLDEEIESLDDVTYALPNTFRNVEDGLGYVIGIDSKYIPYEECIDEEGLFISCGSEDPFWY